jgi:hypothetical protein
MIAGLILFIALAIVIAGLLNKLDEQYCMGECCDPIDEGSPESNGKCWDCYGTGHTHLISESGKSL